MGETQDRKRIWAPTIDSNAGCLIDKSHVGNCWVRIVGNDDASKKCGTAAASCAIETSKFVSSLRDRLSSASPRFSTSVVTSRQNKLLWPRISFENLDQDITEDFPSALFFASQFFFENLSNDKVICSLTLPCDQATKFLDNLARQEAKKKFYFFSDYAHSLTLLPSISRSVSLLDITTSISNNYRLVNNIKSFSVSSAPASFNEEGIIAFIQKGKKLESLSLPNCSLRRVASTLLLEIQKTEITTLNLEENDLGIEDEQGEDIIGALGDLLKYNKFLLKVNLSNNHFTPKQIRVLLDAIASSDTTLIPDDLPPEPEEELAPAEDYIKRHLFLGGTDSENEVEENEEEEMEEEEEEEEASPLNGEMDGEDDPKKGDEEEEEENPEEDEDEGTENSKSDNDNVEEDDEEQEEKSKIDPRIVKKFKALSLKLFREEGKARKRLVLEYLRELLNVAQERMSRIREQKEKEKKYRIEKYCKRRSGWSQLEELNLSGNRVADIGASGIALILRDEVQLTSDEVEKIESTLREKNDVLLNELAKERETTTAEEIKTFRKILFDEQSEREVLRAKQRSVSASKENNSTLGLKSNDEQTSKRQVRRSSIVFTNMDEKDEEDEEDRFHVPPQDNDEEEEISGGVGGGEKEEADGDEGDNGIMEREEELDDREPWNFAVKPTKKGLNSIRVLDLGGCEIRSRGLKKISSSLESNKKLETLILRNNTRFAALLQSAEGIEADDEEEEGPLLEKKIEVPHYISPGFASFCSMLRSNKFLKNLDLGYCQLSPDSISLLSLALRENSSLEYLNLEGNKVGEALGTLINSSSKLLSEKGGSLDEEGGNAMPTDYSADATGFPPVAVEDKTPLPSKNLSCLLQLLQALRIGGTVKHLYLNHMNLSHTFQKEEFAKLAELSSKQLVSLQLNNVGFSTSHLTLWSQSFIEQIIGATSLRSLQLNRNGFAGPLDGELIGQVVGKYSTSLIEISINDNHKLTSSGVAAVAAGLSSCSASPVLRSFSANRTGITTFTLADGSFVIPVAMLSSLKSLSLGDMSCNTLEALSGWITYLQSHASELLYLSMWSRFLDMELHLEPFLPLIESLDQLLYIDFGVLLRFDMYPPDVVDTLGAIEHRLTARRLQRAFKDIPMVFSVDPASVK